MNSYQKLDVYYIMSVVVDSLYSRVFQNPMITYLNFREKNFYTVSLTNVRVGIFRNSVHFPKKFRISDFKISDKRYQNSGGKQSVVFGIHHWLITP